MAGEHADHGQVDDDRGEPGRGDGAGARVGRAGS
jgi:hypothetical protein